MDINQLQEKIENLESILRGDKKKLIRLGIINHELDVLREDLLTSSKMLGKEKMDVEELEKKNIKSLFTEILGNKEEQLKKERQEYLQEVLRHNSLIDEINTLVYEQKILKDKIIEDRTKIESDLEKSLKLKETLLLNDHEFRVELLKFDNRLKVLSSKSRDIYEAIKEGKVLNSNMNIIKANLKKVKEWGQYKMHGKGRYSSYSKKNYIDKANRKAIIVNVYIKKFSKELQDVFPDLDVNLSIDYFENFLKHFYNNLITDWVIQRKLDNATHGITLMIDKINRIQLLLEKERELTTKEKQGLKSSRMDFVKSYS